MTRTTGSRALDGSIDIQPAGMPARTTLPAGLQPVPLTIWDADGCRRLDAPGESIHVAVHGGVHASPAATVEAVRAQLGLAVAFLRVTADGSAELEQIDPRAPLPEGWNWAKASMMPPPSARVHWHRPGWLRQMLAVADRELAPRRLTRPGAAAQVRHTSLTGMLRIDTTAGPVWLKALPPPFRHEAAVVRWLSPLAAYDVPQVLAAGDGWWIAADFAPPGDGAAGDPLVPLAESQAALASRVGELGALGCPERTLPALVAGISALVHRGDLLGSDDRARLERALPALERQCAALDRLGFPPTLVHGDVSPGNVRWTGGRWLIYDWTDACIAHPFLDLASPLGYETDAAAAAARAAAYAAVWAARASGSAAERALALAPAVGAAHQALTYVTLADTVDRSTGDQASGDRLVEFLRYWVDRLMTRLVR